MLQRTRSGDGEAEMELARGLLELTAVVTRHLAPPTMRTLDAIQEANVVLMALLQDRSVASPVHALPGALSRRFVDLEEDDEAWTPVQVRALPRPARAMRSLSWVGAGESG